MNNSLQTVFIYYTYKQQNTNSILNDNINLLHIDMEKKIFALFGLIG